MSLSDIETTKLGCQKQPLGPRPVQWCACRSLTARPPVTDSASRHAVGSSVVVGSKGLLTRRTSWQVPCTRLSGHAKDHVAAPHCSTHHAEADHAEADHRHSRPDPDMCHFDPHTARPKGLRRGSRYQVGRLRAQVRAVVACRG